MWAATSHTVGRKDSVECDNILDMLLVMNTVAFRIGHSLGINAAGQGRGDEVPELCITHLAACIPKDLKVLQTPSMVSDDRWQQHAL
jgi:hypothetical protein